MFYGRGSEIPKSDREETRCALFFLPGAIRPRLIYGETEARPTHALFFRLQNTEFPEIGSFQLFGSPK